MTLLDKVKSLLGLETSRPESADDRDVGVTVEHEPDDEEEADAETAEEAESEEQTESEPDTESEEQTESEPDTESEDSDVRADDKSETEESSESDGDLEDLKGIGPSYAEKLGDAGIETIADLADADAEKLAAETDLSEGRLEDWIERARAH